jgi:Zn-dependent protease with chaperone function
MNYPARFYNGVSAKAFEVNCYLSGATQELILETEDEQQLHFSFRELRINHREKEFILLATTGTTRRIIEIRNAQFIEEFLHLNRMKEGNICYHRLLNAGLAVHIGIALGVLAFCAGLYFYVVPALAEKAVDYIPLSVDEKLGASFTADELFTGENDSLLSVELNRFLREMAPELDSRYRITAISDDQVNAFALPDGRMMIYTGLLEKMDQQEQLAAVMAHEIAHVTHRHSMRLLCRNLSGYLLLTLILNDVNGLMTIFIDNAHQLQNLSYSRKFEREADLSGLALLEKHRIQPNGMISLFRILEKENDISIPGWMSTHPVSSERIDYLQHKIKTDPYHSVQRTDLEKRFLNIKELLTNYN